MTKTQITPETPDTGALEDAFMAADESADRAVLTWQYTMRPSDKRAARAAIAKRDSLRSQIVAIRGSMPHQLDYCS